jgi:hypothetical protein
MKRTRDVRCKCEGGAWRRRCQVNVFVGRRRGVVVDVGEEELSVAGGGCRDVMVFFGGIADSPLQTGFLGRERCVEIWVD